jgi:L-fucose isomerase
MSIKPGVFKLPPYQVGIMGFSDGRFRVHKTLEDTIVRHGKVLADAISKDPLLEVCPAKEIAYSAKLARQGAIELRSKPVEAAVFNIPVFAFPNYSLIAARVLGLPVLLSSPKEGKLPGLGGIMAAHGAMKQANLRSYKMWGNPLEESLLDNLSAYCRACGVIERMKGSVYGLFGGRSIGMNTGVPNTAEWMRKFGVDVEHIDQLEIIRQAGQVEDAEADKAYKWICDSAGKVSTEGKAAPENVKAQIKQYIAICSIVEDLGLDFVGIKCHYDLSEYYFTACFSAMLLNDPYDWNGDKEPLVAACEADSDGALTMQILKLISGYPSLLFDVRSYDFDSDLFVCCNCGAQPSWYAGQSSKAEDNLAKVFVEPVISKYGGGGAHYPYVCKAGEITVARLTREGEKYRMFLARGEFVDMLREKMAETCSAWPHGYIKMNIEPEDFLSVFSTNHAHVIPGDHVRAIEMYCDLMDIEVDRVRD